MNIVIVGAGFGGISAAALLAQKGLEVTVIEKNE
ncbi:MAG: FAD-dependent oxidoreductase, partial [Methanothermobacter sp.]|nr:FAD-dependent oxidoreductase [Methanothermobacter sp.]